jgi:serine/threonine-protein kinase
LHATLDPLDPGATTPPLPHVADTTTPAPTTEAQVPDDEAAKVERLLGLIASQSHFEERYELHETLARGGMGQVIRAYDRILRREVAIKMMADSSSNHAMTPAVRGQFLKEARVGGRLLHPNILAVFDLGVNRSNHIYYTMRLVEGASLQHCLDSVDKGVVTKLISYPLRKIVEAFVGACQGVDYAHQNGVIHLDLKPQNILVSGFQEVFVIDWGLARVDEVDDTDELVDLYRHGSSSGFSASMTLAGGGRVVGTPGYMAPEQAQGNYHSFNPTTDVYGLGGILYFILYGKPPNQGGHLAETLAEVSTPKKKGRLRQGILPRGWRVKKEAQQAVQALEAVCLKALEIDQQNRYPDVEKLIADLNDWLSTTPGPPHGF